MTKTVKKFLREYSVVYYEEHCGTFDIVKKSFGVNYSNKDYGAHDVSVKKAIKIINKMDDRYYFFYMGHLPNEVVDYLRKETRESAVRALYKDTLCLGNSLS